MIRVLLSALCSLQRRLSYLVTRRPEIWDCARAGKRRAPPIRMLIISLRPLYSMSLWRNNGLSDEGKYAANLCDNHGTSI